MKTYFLVRFLYPDVAEEQSIRLRGNVMSTSDFEAILPEGSRVTSFHRVQDCEKQKSLPADECGPQGVEGTASGK